MGLKSLIPSKTAFTKRLYKIHVYVGLFVAFHFALFALSGLALLFRDELEAKPQASVEIAREETPALYAETLSNVLEKRPNHVPLALFPNETVPSQLQLRLSMDGSPRLRNASRTHASLITREESIAPATPTAGFFDWMLELHREFFLGSNGKLYVGFVGSAYVFLLISGIVLYGKFMRGRSFGQIRSALTLKLADLHKYVGFVTFGWSLIVGLSGVFLAFNGILLKLFQAKSLQHLSRQYAGGEGFGSVDTRVFQKVLESALAAKPGYDISYVSFPGSEFGIPGQYLILMNGTDFFTSRMSELVVIDATTGLLSQIVDLPLYLKIVLLSEPLHFGDFGGMPLKIFWALFTVGSLAVACFGVAAFWVKRRRSAHA